MFLYIITGALPAIQQLPPQPPTLLLFKMTLLDVNAGLASLSESNGFRRYMKSAADHFRILGSIQRLPTTRAELVLVCTEETFRNFLDGFMKDCVSQGMFKTSVIQESPCHFPPTDFQILRSVSHHVQNGRYSSNEYDGRSTTSSADREVGRG
jgi:hypothetical protein